MLITRPLLGVTLALCATLFSCTEAKLKAAKHNIGNSGVAQVPVVPPTTGAQKAGFAIVYGGNFASHPNAKLYGSIGTKGQPLVQTSASIKAVTGIRGALSP